MPFRSIPPQDAHAAIIAAGAAAVVIDVRTPGEFAGGHVPGARNTPLDRLDPAAIGALRSGGGALFVICQGGVRSRTACQKLESAGLIDLVDIAGGTNAWLAAGLPIEGGGSGGGSCFGVERQVRSIIGLGVLTGAILAIAVNPTWAVLSAFFGAGLLMAGLTDRCPLALLVAAMPWNRSAPAGGSCCVPAAKPGSPCCDGVVK
jgi:rhodanese-related sulfurtransferase